MNANKYHQLILKKQDFYIKKFKQSDLVKLVKSNVMQSKKKRFMLLDALQPFSDFFQKTVMLRYVFTENLFFLSDSEQHLCEEFGHNISLAKDRKNKEIIFDPILESAAAWFAWETFTLDNLEKMILVHWILEASAHVFFQAAHAATKNYDETDYFKTHAVLDEEHQNIPLFFFENLREHEFQSIMKILDRGWAILMVATNQVAAIVSDKSK
jgi:hypothetical protein